MENENAPEVDNLLNNEPTRINTVQIVNDREPSRTKNNTLKPLQTRTGWHELIRINLQTDTNQCDSRNAARASAKWYDLERTSMN